MRSYVATTRSMPVVAQFQADPPAGMRAAMEYLARQLRRERPDVLLKQQHSHLHPEYLEEGPTLHFEDLSEIPRLKPLQQMRFYEDRARLRAGNADILISCSDPCGAYEEYCRDYLGLGSPTWIRPAHQCFPLPIADAAWADSDVRAGLVRALRKGDLRYLHPSMGTSGAWRLSWRLQHEANCPLFVIAPPPGITNWTNHKVEFAKTVSRLFGPTFIPRTESARNIAELAESVRKLASSSHKFGFKVPNSAGSDGNVVVESRKFRRLSLAALQERLQAELRPLKWAGECELLVSRWETNAICSPSIQLWIPPVRQGSPIVEGIFVQTFEGPNSGFVGTVAAELPGPLSQEITDRGWLLASLFQKLGYLGRCSMDLILVGDSVHKCRLMFIECNGRWGGTSHYMTLMNRLFGDWRVRPFALHSMRVHGLTTLPFGGLLNAFRHELFDVRTGNGKWIFSCPGQVKYQSAVTAIVLAPTYQEAAREVRTVGDRIRTAVG